MEVRSDPTLGMGGGSDEALAAQPYSVGKRKLVRRAPATAGDTPAPAASVPFAATASSPRVTATPGTNGSPSPASATNTTGAVSAVQDVSSEAEANALVKRIRQLESEGAMLSNTLTKVCDENSRLSGQVSALETKMTALAEQPLEATSVLHSLFEPEKTGWFGGSKTAAREQLEKLSEALQAEFMAYKASHASSNDEVQALVEGLHNAHLNAQELGKVVREQQQKISNGPSAVAIRVLPQGEQVSAGAFQELQAQLRRTQEQHSAAEEQVRSLQTELRTLRVENTRLRNEAITSAAAAPPVVSAAPKVASAAVDTVTAAALAKANAERDRLRDTVAKLRNTVVEKDKEVAVHTDKVAQLQNQLTAKDSVHAEEMEHLKQKLAESFNVSMACSRCDELRQELGRVRDDLAASQVTVQNLRSQILASTTQHEEKYRAIERKLAESAEQVSAKDRQLMKSTSADDYEKVKLEQEALTREIELYKQRIAFLEDVKSEKAAEANAALNETEVLEMLSSSKDRISKLEFERDQILVQLKQAQDYAVAHKTELHNLRHRSEDDKQRVTFLLKKCASLTSDLRSVTTQLDTFKEQYEKQSLALKQEKRNTESLATVQRQFDDLTKEKRLLEERLAATREVEERLVKAKETIAYMELAQSSNINMSQYAALKAEKEKLANTMEPLQRRLEDAMGEVERLKSVTDAQQAISSTQNNNVRTWQDQVTALSESESKLREKVTMLTSENTRLTQLNASLEQQMNDMQNGIREMAVHMEQNRSTSKATAEANSMKTIQGLQEELAQARATIAEVQARDGQYVAEGLYQSVVTERERANEEVKRLNGELEKRKSEILIYRQTIADLEQENEERVKEIESLQDRYQADRTALNDRLTKEQKKIAELTSAIAANATQLSAMEAGAAKSKASIAELQEKTAKQQRAFEDKCRREEALSDEIKRLQGQINTLQAAAVESGSNPSVAAVALGNGATTTAAALPVLAVTEVQTAKAGESRAASPAPALEQELSTRSIGGGSSSSVVPVAAPSTVSSGPEPIVIEAFHKRLYDLQTENERIAGELKQTQLQRHIEAEEDRRTITMLQTQIKNKMSSSDRTAYTAAIAKSESLKKSVESLMAENAELRSRVGLGSAAPSAVVSAAALAIGGSQQMDALQMQAQLQEQKATFDAAMDAAAQDRKAYEARIQELEEQLHKLEETAAAAAAATAVPALAADATHGAAGDDENDGEIDSSPLGKPLRKKVKRVKKKKTLAEQVGALDDGEDILAAAPAANPIGDHDVHASLEHAQRELAQVKAENTQLKSTIAALTAELQQSEEDIRAAHEDLELAQTSLDEERRDLNKQIALLQEQSGVGHLSAVEERQVSSRSGNSSFAARGTGSFRNQAIADSQMQLRRCQDELERLQTENRDLKNRLSRAEASGLGERDPSSIEGIATVAAITGEVRKLQKRLKQKEAEVRALADQLMPTKEKLVEYMAMADRLGLQYPFPPELEGATVLRMKALRMPVSPRALSAPALSQGPSRRPSARSNVSAKAENVSPPPRAPRRRKAQPRGEEDDDLR